MLTSCAGTSAAPFGSSNALSGVTVQISPASAAVTTGSVQPFTASVGNTSLTTVSWLVNGIVGGNAFVGSIDSNGNYTAPLYVPIPNVVTVTAAANADNSKQANATVTLSGTPLPVKVSPASVNLYYGGIALLTASVALSDTAVTWEVAGVAGGNAAYGTVTPLPGNEDQAIYVAPLTSNQSQIPVTAVSVEENQYFGSATILLSSPPAGSPVVTLSPANGATVPTGWTQTFQATVTNTKNTGVAWLVDGIAGGNASVGTIAPGPDNTAVFTSPAQVPTPNQVYVTAASDAVAEVQATTTVTVTQAPPLQVVVSQNDICQNLKSVGAGTQVQFTATVTGAKNQGVTWEVNQVPGGDSTYGTITTSGLYTAPSTIPTNPNVTIGAVSQLDNKTTGTLPLTLAIVPTPAVTISPTTATVETCANCGDLARGNWKHSRKGRKFRPDNDQYPPNQTFTATAQFSGEKPNYEVTWSLTNNGQNNGSVTAVEPPPPNLPPCQTEANYDGPPTVPNPSTINVTATSVVDPQASASAKVTIVQGPQYYVVIDPSTPVSLSAGQPQTYNATVYDGNNGQEDADQNFTWTLSSPGLDCTASGSPCGTVNPSYGNGQQNPKCPPVGNCGTVYTAPAVINNSFTVTLTGAPDVDPSAPGNQATINLIAQPYVALVPSSAGCPADAGSGNSPDCTDGSSVVTFTLNTNLPDSNTVIWQMSCISWNDSYDHCYSTHGNNNYDGPGCISVPGKQQQCSSYSEGFSDVPLNEALTYLPPQNLFGSDYSVNPCSQNDGTNGYVAITATVSASICGPGGNQQCAATACVRVCPAGTQNCTAP
ncbi:MAG TPA: hypothetical protein VEF05_15375 [Terriglobales bacterium]|nr:hypothetical protein [Terriglobales bacterium]